MSSTNDSPKREAILAAALELFVERGFHGTAVPLVAEHAGVGAGTIYRYFASKEALVNALYQELKLSLLSKVLDAFPWQAPAREQFHALISRMAAFAVDNPRAFAFLELHHHAGYLDEKSLAIEERIVKFALAFLDQTRRQQVTKDLPSELLIAIIYGGLVGAIRHGWEGRLTLDRKALDALEQCLWEAIRR